MTSISVIVPAYNAARTIQLCLESLGQLQPLPSEIIVVDNGSRDDTPRIVQSFVETHPRLPIWLLTERRPGASAARNAGIRAATGDVIAFTDSDCVVTPTWLADLLTELSDRRVDAVAGNIEGYAPQTLLEKFQAVFTLRTGRSAAAVFSRYTLSSGGFPTANLSVRKSLLEAIGGFDESFEIYGEDHDLCRRIYAIGGRIKAVPAATVRHMHRTTFQAFLRQTFGFGRSHAHMLRRCFKQVWRLDLPGWSTLHFNVPGRLWIDFTLADKKTLALLALTAVYPITGVLLLLYLLRLLQQVRLQVRAAQMIVSLPELVGMAGLFFLKCLAIDCGRWYGSCRHRVVCF